MDHPSDGSSSQSSRLLHCLSKPGRKEDEEKDYSLSYQKCKLIFL